MTTILETRELTVRFGGVRALDAVSLTVAAGTIHGVIGPNGAGKSTLFNVISGVYPAEGSLLFEGKDIVRVPAYRRVGLGIGRAFQNIVVSRSQTVEDNLLLGRHHLSNSGFLATGFAFPRARRREREDRSAVRDIAALLGLQDRLGTVAGALPYGEQKRLEFARALCTSPRLLLLDEPVAGMNADESHEMGELITRVRRELDLTVMLVEHDMAMVMTVCDRITVLDFGHTLASGTPAEIQGDEAVIAAYLGVPAGAEEREPNS